MPVPKERTWLFDYARVAILICQAFTELRRNAAGTGTPRSRSGRDRSVGLAQDIRSPGSNGCLQRVSTTPRSLRRRLPQRPPRPPRLQSPSGLMAVASGLILARAGRQNCAGDQSKGTQVGRPPDTKTGMWGEPL